MAVYKLHPVAIANFFCYLSLVRSFLEGINAPDCLVKMIFFTRVHSAVSCENLCFKNSISLEHGDKDAEMPCGILVYLQSHC